MLKSTVLRANKKIANDISKNLLSVKGKNGQNLFIKRELPEQKGFELIGKQRRNGKTVEIVVFRFTNIIAPKFDYDGNLFTF